MISLIKYTLKIKLIRYALVGAVGASIDIFIFLLFTKVVYVNWYVASTLSYLIATIFGYFLTITFVFISGVKFNKYQEFSIILLIASISYILHHFFLYVFIELLHIDQLLSKLITIVILFSFNFFTRSKLVFNKEMSNRPLNQGREK